MRLSPTIALLTVLLALIAPQGSSAQLATVRGRVVDGEGSSLGGVNIALRASDGRLIGTATDDGFFLISRIPPGDYVLTASFIGFTTITDSLSLAFGDAITRNYTLLEDAAVIETIIVESERSSNPDRPVGLSIVSPQSLARIPSPGLSRDLAAALTRETGVVTLGDRGGQLFIRGGTPMQNLFLLDGMRILQPLHILNQFSVFPSDILSYADVYAGGFGAYYGGRIASVVDVNTRNGNKKRFQGSASVSPFLAAVHAEIPIIPEQASIIVSVRESLIRDFGDNVLGDPLPYRFGDSFVKAHAFLNETSNLAFTSLRSHDSGNLAGNDKIDREVSWTNEAYGFNYFYLSQTLPILTEITVSTTRFSMQKGERDDPEQSTNVGGFEGSFNFGYLLGSYQVHFGIFAQTQQLKYTLGRRITDSREEFVTEGGAFIEGRFDLPGKIHVVPGVRAHSFPSRNQSYAEPRLQVAFPIPGNEAFRLSAAWGIYHQEVVGLTDDRVASDIFTVWTPSPDGTPIPRSRHVLLGLSGEFFSSVSFKVEGYHRESKNIAFPLLGEPLTFNSDFINARSIAKGVDLRLNVQLPVWFLSLDYDLGSIEYFSLTEDFRPPHDRRHSVRLTAGALVRGFRITAGWQYGSGLPFTQLDGYFQNVDVTLDDSYRTQSGETRLNFAESYGGRLPAFHRLDATVERSVEFGQRVRVTAQGSIINAYGRRNWFDLDYTSLERVDQLPLIPSLGLKVEFR